MKLFSSILCCFFLHVNYAQEIARFEVQPGFNTDGLAIPIHVKLDDITAVADSALQLFKLNGKEKQPVRFQVSNSGERTLYWLAGPSKSPAKLQFVLEAKAGINTAGAPLVTFNKQDGILTLAANNKPLLSYVYKTMYPPQGIDTAYKKSGFIHPFNTPHGQSLTRIQAPDHYHHYGLWNPWTKILFEGDTVDCWNLRDRKGTVRFEDFVSATQGDVYAEFSALQQHIVFKKTGGEKNMMNELQTVRVYSPAPGSEYYIMDITVQLNCAGSSPVLLEAYRYGGLGWRATEQWNKDNSTVITSEGKSRKEADGSLARWCIVQGQLGNDSGGAVMMSYPANYNHPEPLRIWPEDSNGRGDMFANFSPTKNKDWLLQPGKDYLLRYRFLVFNGLCKPARAEAAWQAFAHPPVVTIKRLSQKTN